MRCGTRALTLMLPLAVSGCQLLSPLVPCAVDDECESNQVCSDGFCADDDGEGPDRGEGEGEGEGGEGEGEPESHPLRGAPCTDVGAVSQDDSQLSCSIFSTLQEACDDDGDCGDPGAPHCIDPGPGPAFCAADAGLSRSICGAAGGDAEDVVDLVDESQSCINGHALFRATASCITSRGYGEQVIGGDLTIRVNHGVDDPDPPCLSLEFLSTELQVLGGSFFLGRDARVVEQSSAQAPLAAIRFFEMTAVLGDFRIEGAEAAVSNAAFEVKHIGGDLRFVDDPALEDIDFTELDRVGGDLVIDNVPLLAELRLPLLGVVGGDVVVRDAPLLPRCALEALFASVDIEGSVTIEGVDDAATCE